MNSEDKFKDLLNNKLGEKEFDFKPEQWDTARQMIDDTRASQKRRLAFILSGLLLLIPGLIFIYSALINPTNTAYAEAKPAAADISHDAAKLKAGDHVAAVEPINSAAPAQPQLKAARPYEQADKEAFKAPAPEIMPAGIKEKAANSAIINEKPVKNEGIAPDNNTAEPQATAGAKRRAATEGATITAPDAGTQDNGLLPAAITQANTAVPTANENVAAVTTDNNNNNNTPVVTEHNINAPATGTLQNNPAALLPESSPAKDSSIVDPPLTAATNTSAAVDSAAGTMAEAAIPDLKLPPRRFISIEAGTTYLAGWKTGGKREGNGFNPVIGINYMNLVTQKAGIAIGVQYTSIAHLGYYSHVSTISRYGFGEENVVTKVTPLKAHYLVAPIRLSYAINAKNTVGAGYTLCYLVGVKSRVETYDERMDVLTNERSSNAKGFTQGFNSFDSQLSVFYRRMLYDNLYLHAEVLAGTKDLKTNAFFGSATFERAMGLKVTLIYHIFKK